MFDIRRCGGCMEPPGTEATPYTLLWVNSGRFACKAPWKHVGNHSEKPYVAEVDRSLFWSSQGALILKYLYCRSRSWLTYRPNEVWKTYRPYCKWGALTLQMLMIYMHILARGPWRDSYLPMWPTGEIKWAASALGKHTSGPGKLRKAVCGPFLVLATVENVFASRSELPDLTIHSYVPSLKLLLLFPYLIFCFL